MSTATDAALALLVLSAVGVLPTLALVGTRWIAVTLTPLAGAVVAAGAATVFVAVGGSFMVWFWVLGVVVAGAVVAWWGVRPDQRPRPVAGPAPASDRRAHRVAGVVGAVGIVAVCAWSLRSLSSPTVGFDARALWILRAGWFLQPHAQMLVDLRLPQLILNQTTYPPLVSAGGAVAWSVTGNHTDRLAVVVTALLNTCALATAAFALVECGRRCARAASGGGDLGAAAVVPMAAGVVAAVLLVPIAFGVTEPFITNGYADPIWSLAALGAVAYGLQLPDSRSQQGAAALLLLVAGLSKDEGFATALVLIALVAGRRLATLPPASRRSRWWPPVVVAGLEVAAVSAWPLLMRVLHARGTTTTYSRPGQWPGRARATVDGFTPYLHVLLVAVPVAVVGGLLLSRVRRSGGMANDWWGWAGLSAGLAAVGGALVTGSDDIRSWLVTTVHRVTEFPALAGWWIVAVWLVVATTAPLLASLPDDPTPPVGDGSDADPGREPERPEPVGVPAAPAPVSGGPP
jgi:hypothetical protein